MATNSNKTAVIVGVFIVLGLVIFMAGVLTLGGQKKTFEKKVSIKAVFNDVNGLQSGNNIWFLGVKVGTVKKISFIGNSQVEVLMNIETKAQKFIKKDSRVKISSESLIGNKIIVIFGGSAQQAAVVEDDVLMVDNGISTDEMMATLQKNNKNLLEITDNIGRVSKRLANGEGSVGKLLSDETLANELQTAMLSLQQAALNAKQLTLNISGYTAQLRSKGSLANDLVTDTVVFSSLKASVLQLQQVSARAHEITDNIKLVSNNLVEVSNNLNSTKSPIGVLLTDPEAGNNLKASLANLNSGTQKLDEDLEALQHNFLFRGFFKKKAKLKENK